MIDPAVLLTFIPVALALNLTPGADMMFCLGQGLRSGGRAAVAGALGVSMGGMVHVLLAGLGLGAVMAHAPWMFDVVRWAGVGYLLWLAIGALRHGAVPPATAKPAGNGRAFVQGMLVNLSNPKVILFVLALVPQFVDASRAILPQFLIFGAVLAVGGALVNGCVGALAGGAAQRLIRAPRFNRIFSYLSAGIFGALALRLAQLERA